MNQILSNCQIICHNLKYLPIYASNFVKLSNTKFSEIGKCRIGFHNLSMTRRCLLRSPICLCHPPASENIGNYHAIGCLGLQLNLAANLVLVANLSKINISIYFEELLKNSIASKNFFTNFKFD